MSLRRHCGIVVATLLFLSEAVHGQQLTQTIPPVTDLNSQYVQGVAPGYAPSAGSGLTLNVAPGTAHCNGAVVTYAGGTLAMSPSTVNYVYLNAGAGCAPDVNTSGFELCSVPIAQVATGASDITSITDDRTWFGTGLSVTSADVGIGTVYPTNWLHVYGNGYSGGITVDNSAPAQSELDFADAGAVKFQIYRPAFSDDLGFFASGAGLGGDVMRLKYGSGRLGIGTTDPQQKLDVNGSGLFALNGVSFSATPAFDASLGNTQRITLAGNITSSTLVNASAGEFLYFIICQDAAGSRTFIWPANVKGGMTIGTTAGTCSAQAFVFDGNNAYALTPGVANQ